jgi:hypothetical protein
MSITCAYHGYGHMLNKHGICKSCKKATSDVIFVNNTNWLGIECKYGSALISNTSLCCESWGIKIDSKEYRDTADGTVIGITRRKFKHTSNRERRDGEYAEVSFTAGDLGLCYLWCEHNGYYSHDVVFDFNLYKNVFEL